MVILVVLRLVLEALPWLDELWLFCSNMTALDDELWVRDELLTLT
jgi:hypothetical protein